MVQCISNFLDACYLVCHADINKDTITKLESAIMHFHESQEVFQDLGVQVTGFSLPWQHSLTHYPHQIQEFGAPAGLCSSITESRHIMAIKRPWQWSNQHNALGQMLLMNQCLDKLQVVCNNFVHQGMLPPSHGPPPKPILMPDEDEDGGPIDDYVTGTVTLARMRHMSIGLTLMGYADFEHQNKSFPMILQGWRSISTGQALLNLRTTFFMTSSILMAHRQMKYP